MRTIRIVLGEDHSLVREGTRQILEQNPDMKVVGEAGDGEQALRLIEVLQPDVAVMDIRMPGLSGIEVVRRMRQRSPHTEALVLTAYDDDDYILASMEAGAMGFLPKTARAGELVEAVRSLSEGEPALHPSIAAKVARLWATQATRRRERTATKELSSREREVLLLAAKGMRNKAIAEALGLSVRTVEGHFSSILGKLGVSSRTEAVLYAVARHWIDPQEGEQ